MNRCSAWALLAWAALAAPAWAEREGPHATARRIDRLLASAWADAKVTPARAADDAEYLRRVYLDLAGRIPTVAEAWSFLGDKRPDRRARLVDKLLASPRFVTHMARVYRTLLIPEAGANLQVRFGLPGFDRWLEDWLSSGKGMDVLARELIEAPLTGPNPRAAIRLGQTGPTPSLFYSAKDYKPEEIAGDVSRTLLGVNIGCAQCHDHPFASWKREQFWSFAAFFGGIQSRRQGDFTALDREQADRAEITIPNTGRVMKARYLDGKEAKVEKGESARAKLAAWITDKSNPYFARATVNRTWAHFFGTGLMEPIDEMAGGDNTASQPKVLDELAEGFVASGHDLRWLMRAITASRAYQLSSARSHPSQDDPRHFARAAVRGLTGEQLYDSLVVATGHRETGPTGPRAFFAGGGNRDQFLAKFNTAGERPVDVQASILQALTLMNGRLMTVATRLESSEVLHAIAEAPYLDTAGKVEALYLAALSRKPTDKEKSRVLAHVTKATDGTRRDPARGQKEALADVFWVLLNSAEFYFNH